MKASHLQEPSEGKKDHEIQVEEDMKKNQTHYLKYFSLFTLMIQSAALALSIRYARVRKGKMFLSSTAVFMVEFLKLLISLGLLIKEEKTLQHFISTLRRISIEEPLDTLKVCVLSLVYIIQNNLLYIAVSHLDAATFQVTHQLKILTTAMFTVLILRRSLRNLQWIALVVLLIGVVIVQLAQIDPSATISGIHQNRLLGLGATFTACLLSGFGGTYFEMILKGSEMSLWMRNVQLSFLSLPFGLITCLVFDHEAIKNNGFFFGYNYFVVYVIILQASGGLTVGVVVKYADSILKGFATSLAIVITCVASVFLFNFQITFQFSVGALLVICSIFIYCHKPSESDAGPRMEV